MFQTKMHAPLSVVRNLNLSEAENLQVINVDFKRHKLLLFNTLLITKNIFPL